MAVNLNNFTLNTNFPAVAKMTSANRTCTLSGQTINAWQTVSNSVDVSVGSGQICETLLYVDNEYVPYTRLFASGSYNSVLYEYVTERISSTQIRFTITATNYTGSSIYISAKSASVQITAFSVP